jgi:hypothetical protein
VKLEELCPGFVEDEFSLIIPKSHLFHDEKELQASLSFPTSNPKMLTQTIRKFIDY